MLATAVVVAGVFGTIYFIVNETVYQHLDNDLTYEAYKHINEVDFEGDNIRFINKDEWEESEHNNIQVNPVFLQLINANGEVRDKSPNLKDAELPLLDESADEHHQNLFLEERPIRQLQIPLKVNGQTKGYIVAAMSSKASIELLENLQFTLLLLFPMVLVVLFFLTQFLADRSIKPVQAIITTTNRITKNNLSERIDYPERKDELYQLTKAINELLDRIETALIREKEFTSDAAHELRTPLAVIRGTLEVLIRKERTPEEYKKKIAFTLTEIDRITEITEQLLRLARVDGGVGQQDIQSNLNEIIENVLARFNDAITSKEIHPKLNLQTNPKCPTLATQLVLENILSNAIKYSNNGNAIEINASEEDQLYSIEIKDFGVGIAAKDLSKVFQPFFRAERTNKAIEGIGLGLAIAQKTAQSIGAKLELTSEEGVGTTVTFILRKS